MHVEVALVRRILDSAALTALLGAADQGCRLYPQTAPAGTERPYAVYRRISGASEQEMAAASGWAQARVQFDCYAVTHLAALEVAEALRRLFDGWAGAVTSDDDSLELELLQCEEISTDFVPPTPGAEEGLYVASVDVLAVYQAVIPVF